MPFENLASAKMENDVFDDRGFEIKAVAQDQRQFLHVVNKDQLSMWSRSNSSLSWTKDWTIFPTRSIALGPSESKTITGLENGSIHTILAARNGEVAIKIIKVNDYVWDLVTSTATLTVTTGDGTITLSRTSSGGTLNCLLI